MAFGVGNLGNIVEDFSSALSEIFGGAAGTKSDKGGTEAELFNKEVGGSIKLDRDKWVGNSKGPKIRYGFAILTLKELKNKDINSAPTFYLDIPPQSIMQKEIFANNITATRKGVIVESEGVVFRDIILQGTTGVFPGQRGGSNVGTSNLFKDPFKAPGAPAGVDPDTGTSRASGVNTISGYEEFLRLRQFFIKYATDKRNEDGDRFLIFINEKDNQTLVVEPVDFTMDRNKQSPMTYNYKIVLKGIGDLGTLFAGLVDGSKRAEGIFGLLEDAGNLAANTQVAIQQGRATMNQSSRLLRRISESVDQTVNGTLRQVQFALEDLRDAKTTVLALPEILSRNFTDSIGNIRENFDSIFDPSNNVALPALKPKPGEAATNGTTTAEFTEQREIAERINNDSTIPVQRTFLEDAKDQVNDVADNLADFVGLGDSSYDEIKGRVVTNPPEALKTVSDEELLLLGDMMKITDALNQNLATNTMFASDSDEQFENATEPFLSSEIPEEHQIAVARPDSVREVTIQRNDTLERIAQREYNDALRWLDIVVINNLKPPYIDAAGGDGVRRPGDKLLIGDK